MISLDKQTLIHTLRDDAKLPGDQAEMIAGIVFRSQHMNPVSDAIFDLSMPAIRADIRSSFARFKADIIRTLLGALALQALVVLTVFFVIVSILKP